MHREGRGTGSSSLRRAPSAVVTPVTGSLRLHRALELFIGLGAIVTSACAAGISEEAQVRSQRTYELAVGQYRDERNTQGAVVSLERALQSNPENADAHLLLGKIYVIEFNQNARALPHFQRAVELLRVQAIEDPERQAMYGDARNTYAASLIEANRPDEAIRILTELSTDVHYPAQHLVLGNLGLAHITAHRYRDAIAPLQRAIVQRADFCVGSYRLGLAHLRLNEDARALEVLDRALSTRAPGCDQLQAAYRARAEAHTRLHHPDEARADFTRCRDLGPNTPDGRECASMLRTAVAPASGSGANAPSSAPVPSAAGAP